MTGLNFLQVPDVPGHAVTRGGLAGHSVDSGESLSQQESLENFFFGK
jgi:hypothetical protein